MPRYNLNNEDVDILVNAIDQLIIQTKSHSRIRRLISMRNRLLSKLKGIDSDALCN